MMKFNNCILIVCMILVANLLLGQDINYQYKRSIEGVSEKWHSISLPQDVINHTNVGRTDIRIVGYDVSGQEIKVPYVMESQEEEEVIEKEFVKIFNESNIDSIFVYETEEAKLGKINEIELNIGNANYDGRVKLEGRSGEDWYTILEDYRIFSLRKSNRSYKYTTLEIPLSDYASYRISLSNITKPILNNVSVIKRTTTEGKYYYSNALIRHVEDDDKNNTAKYIIQLDSLSRISEMRFDVEGDFDHYRRMELSAVIDSVKSKSGWQMLKKSIYNGALISYEDKISFNEVLVSRIEMTVYNLDDQPLKINAVKVRTPQYDLVARFLSDSDFYLIYGNSKAYRPSYDLNKFEENIPEQIISLKLGDPMRNYSKAEIDNFFIPTYALWAIMAVIIAVIGWFTIKMLSSETLTEE